MAEQGGDVDEEDGSPPSGADSQVAPPHEKLEGNEVEEDEAEEAPKPEEAKDEVPKPEEAKGQKNVAAEGEQRAKRSQTEESNEERRASMERLCSSSWKLGAFLSSGSPPECAAIEKGDVDLSVGTSAHLLGKLSAGSKD